MLLYVSITLGYSPDPYPEILSRSFYSPLISQLKLSEDSCKWKPSWFTLSVPMLFLMTPFHSQKYLIWSVNSMVTQGSSLVNEICQPLLNSLCLRYQLFFFFKKERNYHLPTRTSWGKVPMPIALVQGCVFPHPWWTEAATWLRGTSCVDWSEAGDFCHLPEKKKKRAGYVKFLSQEFEIGKLRDLGD